MSDEASLADCRRTVLHRDRVSDVARHAADENDAAAAIASHRGMCEKRDERGDPPKGNTSKSSPIKHRISERGPHSSARVDKLAKVNYHNNIKDMKGEYVGPMPVKDFIKDFLPLPAGRPRMPRLKKSFLHIGTKTSEDDIVS
ncbi:hypothetical protein EWM64_g2091 [Hericium alpestre]|uniref:Uncharacterized protein n=1 Tax=Hericium alpestre TaxID=135208 RepID=A0A4Z0A6N6_9AGAM|nr:hypothetical protein EWM64_g2091 [Hericium alpestre]